MHWQLLAAVLVVAAPAPAEKEKKDEDKIQGTWIVVSAQFGGESKPDDEAKNAKFVIKGDLITISEPKREGREEKATFKLDPTKKPKTIDLVPEKGDKKETVLGIYELKDDELKLCFVKGGKERPTEFASKAGTDQGLIVLKREKKDKDK
jgi:uncharacterized protein (TIGR03067 family)